MRIFNGVSEIDPALRGAVLTVGNFDGVHLGHQRILRTARALAHVSSASVIAMTFEPHPVELLRPGEAPRRLTLWEEKAKQLFAAGADAVVKLDTDWPLLSLSAEDFVKEVLVKRIHPSYIVEGPDFGFGRGRKGDVEMLRQFSPKGGFQVHIVEPYQFHFEGDAEPMTVSSTAVRRLLMSGNVERAAACLGRPFALIGHVVPGAGAGRTMGFPTINLDIGAQTTPAEGVYAGVAEVDGARRMAAVSIGTRPTLGGNALTIEAFLLDSAGDFYGRPARLELLAYVRPQRKFENREALMEQIDLDVTEIRRVLDERKAAS